MDCNRIQSMIVPFINDELNIKELELFLDHLAGCENCMEEVEIYYTLLTAMRQLDEDKSLSGDYRHELEHKLEEAQERIVHAKYTYYRKKAILIIIIALIAFLCNFRYTSDMADSEYDPAESDFQIKRSFKTEGQIELERQLEEYLNSRQDMDIRNSPDE